jgi:hypothetical protein
MRMLASIRSGWKINRDESLVLQKYYEIIID